MFIRGGDYKNMKNYNQVINLDNVFLEDCVELYEKKKLATIINDGHIQNFVVEDFRECV